MTDSITITHYINPHLFWYKRNNENNGELESIEKTLQEVVAEEKRRNPYFRPITMKCGDRVAVYIVNWDKYIRAEVDIVHTDSRKCILWAIDYGFPIETSADLAISLTDEILTKFTNYDIYKGGIHSLIPYETVRFIQ